MLKDGVKVKAVMKTVVTKVGKYIPMRGKGGTWDVQKNAGEDGGELYKMDDLDKTYVLDEKCEKGGFIDALWDTALPNLVGRKKI